MMKFWNWYKNSTKAQFWISFGAGTFTLAFPLLVIGRNPQTISVVVAIANYSLAAVFAYHWWQEYCGTKQKS